AIEQLEQQVSSQCLHSLPPLRASSARENLASMFFECRAMFLALQGKNGLFDGARGRPEPVPERLRACRSVRATRRGVAASGSEGVKKGSGGHFSCCVPSGSR